ncbi:MAG: hypothetical protein GWP91_02640 [Rhodobacterales bacterium]|nr:hypothetical protein [Rhodobacterales bacterium]
MSHLRGFSWSFVWIAFVTTPAYAQECDNPAQNIASAEADVVNFYLADATGYANAAVEGYGCSEVASTPDLARLMRVLAMLRLFNEDEDGAAVAFRTARALDADGWNNDYGEKAQGIFTSATVPKDEAPGIVTVKGLSDGWLAVDGDVQASPVTLPAGLHLVQVGSGDLAFFARIIVVEAGKNVAVDVPEGSDLQPKVRTPRGTAAPVWLHLAAGAVGTSGEGLTVKQGANTLQEPAVKVALLVEAGVGLAMEKLWFRGTFGLEPIFGGSYLYASESTDWSGTAAAVVSRFDVGTALGGVKVGLASGFSWPGRIPLLGVVAIPIGGNGMSVEPRAGVRLATARAVEPTVSVSLAWRTK